MLGHKIVEHIQNNIGHESVYFTTRSDSNENSFYYDPEHNFLKIVDIVDTYKIDVIINCIGLLNSSKLSHDRFFHVNSFFPKKLEKTFIKSKVKIIQISTDCVFDGEVGNYTEDSIPSAKDIYGISKFLGEIINSKDLTIRCSIIGPEINNNSKGLLSWFIKSCKDESINELMGYKNVFWSGISTFELSRIILFASNSNICGLHHVEVPEKISKFELLLLFSKYFKNSKKIKPTTDPKYDKSLKSNHKKLLVSKNYDQIINEMFLNINLNSKKYNYNIK